MRSWATNNFGTPSCLGVCCRGWKLEPASRWRKIKGRLPLNIGIREIKLFAALLWERGWDDSSPLLFSLCSVRVWSSGAQERFWVMRFNFTHMLLWSKRTCLSLLHFPTYSDFNLLIHSNRLNSPFATGGLNLNALCWKIHILLIEKVILRKWSIMINIWQKVLISSVIISFISYLEISTNETPKDLKAISDSCVFWAAFYALRDSLKS